MNLTEFEPPATLITRTVARRKLREYQRKCRRDKSSANDLYEDAAIMVAWEAGEISEGQAMGALQLDRVSAREAKLRLVAFGRALAYSLQ